jgi:hypothetical protein
MRELLRLVKVTLRAAAVEAEERLRAQYTLVPKGSSGGSAAAAQQLNLSTSSRPSSALTSAASSVAATPTAAGAAGGAKFPPGGAGAGELDLKTSGVVLGLAPSHARPVDALLPPSVQVCVRNRWWSHCVLYKSNGTSSL